MDPTKTISVVNPGARGLHVVPVIHITDDVGIV